jgi:hypothetical protein
MWPIPSLSNELVSVSFSPIALTCSVITKDNALAAQPTLRAHKCYPFAHYESLHLIPFNPTYIKKCIRLFLSEHNLSNAFIVFCLDGLAETIVALPTSTPHRTDFDMPNTPSIQWEYRYLYTDHEGNYLFYVYAIPRSLILQYELLAIALRCNLIGITTQTVALLDAYKNMFGVAFRKSQLAVDMMRHDNTIEKLITSDAVHRMVRILDVIPAQEHAAIAAAYGIFSSELIFEKVKKRK